MGRTNIFTAISEFLGLFLLTLAFLLLPLPMTLDALQASERRAEQCVVFSVVDGDKVLMKCPSGKMFQAALTGYDTPDLMRPGCIAEFGKAVAATFQLRRILWSEPVNFVLEGTDVLGRREVRGFINGDSLARRMVASGHAQVDTADEMRPWCDWEDF